MKINFGEYTYINPRAFAGPWSPELYQKKSNVNNMTDEEKNKYAYNGEYIRKLYAQNRFHELAEYLRQYSFEDPNVQNEHLMDIYNYERMARKYTKMYSTMSQDDIQKFDFMNNVFGGDLSKLENNKYVEEFCKYRNVIFGNADSLSITFQPQKQSLFGIDWLAKDNDYWNIDTFYKNGNFTEKDLKNAGVRVVKDKNGATTIYFDSNNPLSNKILYALPRANKDIFNGQIESFDEWLTYSVTRVSTDNDVFYDFSKYAPVINQIHSDNKQHQVLAYRDLDNLNDMLHNIQKDNDNTIKNFEGLDDDNERVYTSTVGGSLLLPVVDEMDNYNSYNKANNDAKLALIRGTSLVQQVCYSNFNRDDKSENLEEMSDIERRALSTLLRGAKDNDITLNAMVCDGEVGTQIVLKTAMYGTESLEQVKKSLPKGVKYNGEDIIIFVPGLFASESQSLLNADSNLRAEQELQQMEMYSYTYNNASNSQGLIYNASDGNYYFKDYESGQVIMMDRDRALRELNKMMLSDDIAYALNMEYSDDTGHVTDRISYEEAAKAMAFKAIEDIYPDLPLVDYSKYQMGQDKALLGEIYSKMNSGGYLIDEEKKEMDAYTKRKYKELFEIYRNIMNQINDN